MVKKFNVHQYFKDLDLNLDIDWLRYQCVVDLVLCKFLQEALYELQTKEAS
jgi:hypothetical protein